ncbi:hypothetical protein PRZ48_008700 [Zasmidium cellare]|uniref:Peptidase M20 dimerisation domain-containing protein n=1 Tax=Zasmidium cellare TaxID=395010 RepID=A0ABR0EH02_ZASCE|nr:hypothetical protein PRZ48_008700 [Zasmidium cellare]
MISKNDLIALIDSDRESHLRFLQSLIQTPSPNPPGDTQKAIAVVEDFLKAHDVSSEIIAPKPESPNLVSVFHGNPEGKQRSIALNGHIDQFPVGDADRWLKDPYSGDIENGFVHGRSGVDMKAGTAASIIAFSYLHRYQAQLTGRCVLEVVSDEETGGKFGTRYLIEDDERREEWRADCILIGEPSGLQSIRFGEKGTLRLTFTVTALGLHGAYIHRSEGAIRIASRLIERLVGLEKLTDIGMDEDLKNYMQRLEVRKVADEIMGKGAADAMLIPTVNIGTIKGGDKINMIPSETIFETDIRIPIGVKTETIREYIDSVLKDFPTAKYSVHENHSHTSTHSQPHHELVTLLQENASVAGGTIPHPICSLGATDCKHFRRNGIPAYALGPSPNGMAERDEKVSVDEFLYLVKVHTLAAWDYLGGSK